MSDIKKMGGGGGETSALSLINTIHLTYTHLVSLFTKNFKPRKWRQKFCANQPCSLSHIKTPSRLCFPLCFSLGLLMTVFLNLLYVHYVSIRVLAKLWSSRVLDG